MSQLFNKLSTKIEQMFPLSKRKAIEDWDFIMVFEQYYRGEVELMFSSLQCQKDLTWKILENPKGKTILVVLKLSDEVVIEKSHELKILKKKNKRSYRLQIKEINNLIYTIDKQININEYQYLYYIKSRLNNNNKQIYQQQKYSIFNKQKIQLYEKNQFDTIFNSQQQLRAKYHFFVTYQEKNSHGVKQPFSIMMKHPGFKQFIPIQKISEHRTIILNNNSLNHYLGPNIDCYFSFVSFMQKWLVFPMIIGLISFGLNYHYGYTADNSPFDFIYALFLMVWSILFITRWEQIEKWNKIKYGCGTSESWAQYQHVIKTSNLQRRYSRITGQIEYYTSLKMKILVYAASYGICLIMILITLVFIVLSLNARGFIDPQHKLFYSQRVSSLANAGGLFDRNTSFGQIPNIFHVIVTSAFDEGIFRPLGKKLTKLQRHQNRKNYQNHVIVKYFIYQFLITFTDLFYIAFIRLDIEGLRTQLLSLFFIGIIRRIVSESFIPLILKKYRTNTLENEKSKISKQSLLRISYQNNQLSKQQQLQYGAILQVNKSNYEPFDDYLEIISNFGFLVMLSACFPLAPLLIIIAHKVEIIQDKYKIIHILKRKLPQSYVGMGSWKYIVVFLCYISIVTNILLFAFSSQQIVNFFPKMYEGGKDILYGNTHITALFGNAAHGIISSVINRKNETNIENQFKPVLQQFRPPDKQSQASFVVMLFFIQHFFLLLFALIRYILQKRKSQAQIFMERRQYKRKIKKNLPKNAIEELFRKLFIHKQMAKQRNSKIYSLDSKIYSQYISTNIDNSKVTSSDSLQNQKIENSEIGQICSLLKKD